MEDALRLVFCIALLVTLTACSSPWSEIGYGSAALVGVYSDELSKTDPNTLTTKDVLPRRTGGLVTRVADHVRNNAHATGKHLKDWWLYKPNEGSQTIPSSYCYKAQGDVMCYRSPMPGWEHRLVGYQGTFADAPPAPMMQPLPASGVDQQKLPANRIAATKPVFVEMPPEMKEEPKTSLELEAPENVHENIADPALAPQL